MLKTHAGSGPRLVLDISDSERAVAKEVKEDFKKALKKINKAFNLIVDLRDAIVEQRPTKEDLKNKYLGRLLRYRKKIRDAFNDFLIDVKKALEKLIEIDDPDMMKLREIIIAEMGEFSDGAEAIMDLLKEVDREGFTKTLEGLTAQMEKRKRSMIEVIDQQLFNHIDHDILGKMKISKLKFKIKRRARIIKNIARYNQ